MPVTAVLETLTCRWCGTDFERTWKPGSKPLRCPACVAEQGPKSPVPLRDARDEDLFGLGASVTKYRMAMEIARSGIRIGRYADALAALDEALR